MKNNIDWNNVMDEVYKIGEVRILRSNVERNLIKIEDILKRVSYFLNEKEEIIEAYEKASNGGFTLKELTHPLKSKIINACYPIILNEVIMEIPGGKDYVYGNRMGINFNREQKIFLPSIMSHIITKEGIQRSNLFWINERKKIYSYLQNLIEETNGEGTNLEREYRLLKKLDENLKENLKKGEFALEEKIEKGFEDLVLYANLLY